MSKRATHFAWFSSHGTTRGDLEVCHHCDNPPCVNPAHLFLGTHLDNMRDRDAKGRCPPLLGVKHGMARLTDDQVREIRERRAAGETIASLAREFEMTTTNIGSIVHRETWRHVA